MFQNGKGLFGGSAMASGPMRKPEKERGPFDSTTGKLALLGDLLLRAGGRGGNPMVAHMQRQQMMDRQMQMAKQSREWDMQDSAMERSQPQDAFERSLAAQGIIPGTPQYTQAMAERQAALLRNPNTEPMGMNIPGYGFVFGTPDQIQGVLGSRQTGAPEQLPPDFFD